MVPDTKGPAPRCLTDVKPAAAVAAAAATEAAMGATRGGSLQQLPSSPPLPQQLGGEVGATSPGADIGAADGGAAEAACRSSRC